MKAPTVVWALLFALVGVAARAWTEDREQAAPPAPDPNDPPAEQVAPVPPEQRRPVDLVICLDTSGSMTELIDSARARLWDVVNELAMARPTPQLRVGLLTYGSPRISTADRGWIVRQTDLTSDFDTVYARMMEMTTQGGDEYVGWVLNDALHTMSWSQDPDSLKLIFVAGNESADQAVHRFDFRKVAQDARGQHVFINAIYAGDQRNGVAELWDQVAQYGGGQYASIDTREGTIQIASPQDGVLRKLNAELNATYLAYGLHGAAGAANQEAQDRNAYAMGAQSGGSRGRAKASPLYSNAAWDLVDAGKESDFDLEGVPEQELPEEMRSMTVQERKDYVDGKQAARAEIQKKISEVSAERDRYIKNERAKRKPEGTALDEAMRRSIRTQAEQKGFTFTDAE
ncbi:MAG TPA: vWA domain-containing protein [Phycisphaerae bacterium]|nr:vWA domain-containing protein [Phycisphaerae bacterium]